MSAQPHPELLHGRNLSVPSQQQKILDRQTVAKAPGLPQQDVPPAVLDSLKAQFMWVERNKKRTAQGARLKTQAQVTKLQKQSHEPGSGFLAHPSAAYSSPSTPVSARYNTMAPAPSSSPGSVVSWSPSPDRTNRAAIPRTARPLAPSFPSSGLEEPLEVQLPKAHTENIPTTSQAETPCLRQDVRSIETPPCAQPSQPAQGRQPTGGKAPVLFKHPPQFDWPVPDPTSQLHEGDRPPAEYTLSRRVSPYRSSLPPSSSKTSNIPPPGQTVPHPKWPAPYEQMPVKGSVLVRSNVASEDIMTPEEPPTGEDLRLGAASSQIPMAQTISYVSPDIASQPPAQQVEQFHSSRASAQEASIDRASTQSLPSQPAAAQTQDPTTQQVDKFESSRDFTQELPTEGAPASKKASQPVVVQAHDSMAGVRQAVISQVRRSKSNDEQTTAQRFFEKQAEVGGQQCPGAREESSTTKLPDAANRIREDTPAVRQRSSPAVAMAEIPPRTEERWIAGSAQNQSIESEPAGNSQGPSTTSAVSAIPATQQPVKVSITFDGESSPFETFCKEYEGYSENLESFIKACMCLAHMSKTKALHSSLWDDFVGHWPLFQAYNKGRKDQLYASEWYNDRDEDAVFTKRLINKANLAGILSYHDDMVQKCQKHFHRSPKKQPRAPATQPSAPVTKEHKRAPNGGNPQQNRKEPSPSQVIVIADSQSTQSTDGNTTHTRKSSEKPPAASIGMASDRPPPMDKPAGLPKLPPPESKLWSITSNEVVPSTPGTNERPAPNESASEHQRIAQEALLLGKFTAQDLLTRQETPVIPESSRVPAAPPASKPSSTLSRANGPLTAYQRSVWDQWKKPKGKEKKKKKKANSKKGSNGTGRTSSLARSDAS